MIGHGGGGGQDTALDLSFSRLLVLPDHFAPDFCVILSVTRCQSVQWQNCYASFRIQREMSGFGGSLPNSVLKYECSNVLIAFYKEIVNFLNLCKTSELG